MEEQRYLVLVLGVNDMGKPILFRTWRTDKYPVDEEKAIAQAAKDSPLSAKDFHELFNPTVVCINVTDWKDILTFP